MEQKIKISVRKLVEFVLRSGHIDNRFGGFDRAVQGARLHRKLQKAAGQAYQAEVKLSLLEEYQGVLFFLEGRADGVICEGNSITIDEIKTIGMPLALIDESISQVHWAQATCYGYMLARAQGLLSLSVQLTYCHIETEEIRQMKRNFTMEELAADFFLILDKYLEWARLSLVLADTRKKALTSMPFPYPEYRRGQRPMAAAVYRTAVAGGSLFCQAPTGIGKTMSTLFPALKALGEGAFSRIFYLTAKTIARQAAEQAVALLTEKAGLRLKSITLTAKEKICLSDAVNCNPDACPYARGHFDRVNHAMYALLQKEDHFLRENLQQAGKDYQVCPFELALDLALWCDLIICDYNYVFDPQVSLRRFFAEQKEPDAIFLIDEAHNLPDRAREMYSAVLLKSEALLCRKAVDKKFKKLRRCLQKINQALLELRRSCGTQAFLALEQQPDSLLALLDQCSGQIEAWLPENRQADGYPEILAFYFRVLSYQKTAELYDGHYRTFVMVLGSDTAVKLWCLDPSALLREYCKKSRAAVFFSATLTPLDYFCGLLGGDASAKKLSLPSPFPKERLLLLTADYISTRYQNRQASLEELVRLLFSAVQEKTGNYLVFFPSYQYLQMALALFQEKHPEIEAAMQAPGMAEQEKEAFLQRFSADNTNTLLGFCVLGGTYAEGVDLLGDRLIGSIIIGVGLPQMGAELDVLRAYFEQKSGMGFEFAYQYPGMNKVLQAAGRVIRDQADRGMVLLVDERYASFRYRTLFPLHWDGMKFLHSTDAVVEELRGFWKEENHENNFMKGSS